MLGRPGAVPGPGLEPHLERYPKCGSRLGPGAILASGPLLPGPLLELSRGCFSSFGDGRIPLAAWGPGSSSSGEAQDAPKRPPGGPAVHVVTAAGLPTYTLSNMSGGATGGSYP